MKAYLRKKIKQLRGYIKKSDFLFALRRNIVDKDLKRERKKMSATNVKTRKTIKEEIRLYKNYWKCIPHDYIRYGLFEKNLGKEELLDYIPMHYYYCDFYDKIFNDIFQEAKTGDFVKNHFPGAASELKKLFNNSNKKFIKENDLGDKLLQYLILKEYDIKVPEIIAIIFNDAIYDLNGTEVNLKQLSELGKGTEMLFVKPTDGCGGEGIETLKLKDGIFFNKNNKIASIKDLKLNNARTYIVQRGINQIHDLSQLNSSSLNTLRVITQYDNDNVNIIGIILRLGRKGSFVDNSAQGGVSVAVDMETGRLAKFGGREHGGGRFDAHPDTGFIFEDVIIKDWPGIKAQITEIVSKIKCFGIIGWDLALTDEGAYAIEFNLGFGIEHAQTILGGLRRRLKIDKN